MNIQNIKPTRNNVLVEIQKEHSNEVDLGPVKIEIPVDPNNLSQMMQTEGTVIKCPASLNKTPWETTIQIKEGDHVYFSFNALREAIYQKGSYFTVNGRNYALINYHTLIAVVEKDRVIPLNGYCFIEPVKEDQLPDEMVKKSRLIVTRSKVSAKYGRMLVQGEPNRSYDNEKDFDTKQVIPNGTIVVFKKNSDVVVQYSTHASLFGDKEVYRIQKRNLLAWII